MVGRFFSYVRQHHLALIALFVALGGTGAFAATSGTTRKAQVREFSFRATNTSGTPSGPLASLSGVTLRWKSQRLPDGRTCTLVAKSSAPGQVNSFFATESSGGDKDFFTRGRDLGAPGSQEVAVATFNEGAPGVASRAEGEFTWHNRTTNRVVTGVFHMFAGPSQCLFQGTLTGTG